MDRHRRTIVKTITWRFCAIVITWIIVYLYNKDIKESTIIAFSANIIKTLLYYIHERIWNRFSFGKQKV